jgi:hypothetical protein
MFEKAVRGKRLSLLPAAFRQIFSVGDQPPLSLSEEALPDKIRQLWLFMVGRAAEADETTSEMIEEVILGEIAPKTEYAAKEVIGFFEQPMPIGDDEPKGEAKPNPQQLSLIRELLDPITMIFAEYWPV